MRHDAYIASLLMLERGPSQTEKTAHPSDMLIDRVSTDSEYLDQELSRLGLLALPTQKSKVLN